MPHYRITGKWMHLSYSHHFSEGVQAATALRAVYKFAKQTAEEESLADVQWDPVKPKSVTLGLQEPRFGLWVNLDQLFQIRHVALAHKETVACSTCKGKGVVKAFVDSEA
ncbi:MAG: hypothetical protein HY680_03260 [Chloroflexi bacterium]|nr:hypothetical protein [Chloroflexota bacterium]